MQVQCEGCKKKFGMADLKSHLDVAAINVHDVKFYERCPEKNTSIKERVRFVTRDELNSSRPPTGGQQDSSGVGASLAWGEPKKAKPSAVDRRLKKNAWEQCMSGEPVADSLKWNEGVPRGRLRKSAFQQMMSEGEVKDELKWNAQEQHQQQPQQQYDEWNPSRYPPDSDYVAGDATGRRTSNLRREVLDSRQQETVSTNLYPSSRIVKDRNPKKYSHSLLERMREREKREQEAEELLKADKRNQAEMRRMKKSLFEVKQAAHSMVRKQSAGAQRQQQSQQRRNVAFGQGGEHVPFADHSPKRQFATSPEQREQQQRQQQRQSYSPVGNMNSNQQQFQNSQFQQSATTPQRPSSISRSSPQSQRVGQPGRDEYSSPQPPANQRIIQPDYDKYPTGNTTGQLSRFDPRNPDAPLQAEPAPFNLKNCKVGNTDTREQGKHISQPQQMQNTWPPPRQDDSQRPYDSHNQPQQFNGQQQNRNFNQFPSTSQQHNVTNQNNFSRNASHQSVANDGRNQQFGSNQQFQNVGESNLQFAQQNNDSRQQHFSSPQNQFSNAGNRNTSVERGRRDQTADNRSGSWEQQRPSTTEFRPGQQQFGGNMNSQFDSRNSRPGTGPTRTGTRSAQQLESAKRLSAGGRSHSNDKSRFGRKSGARNTMITPGIVGRRSSSVVEQRNGNSQAPWNAGGTGSVAAERNGGNWNQQNQSFQQQQPRQFSDSIHRPSSPSEVVRSHSERPQTTTTSPYFTSDYQTANRQPNQIDSQFRQPNSVPGGQQNNLYGGPTPLVTHGDPKFAQHDRRQYSKSAAEERQARAEYSHDPKFAQQNRKQNARMDQIFDSVRSKNQTEQGGDDFSSDPKFAQHDRRGDKQFEKQDRKYAKKQLKKGKRQVTSTNSPPTTRQQSVPRDEFGDQQLLSQMQRAGTGDTRGFKKRFVEHHLMGTCDETKPATSPQNNNNFYGGNNNGNRNNFNTNNNTYGGNMNSTHDIRSGGGYENGNNFNNGIPGNGNDFNNVGAFGRNDVNNTGGGFGRNDVNNPTANGNRYDTRNDRNGTNLDNGGAFGVRNDVGNNNGTFRNGNILSNNNVGGTYENRNNNTSGRWN